MSTCKALLMRNNSNTQCHMSHLDHAKKHDACACVSLATCVFTMSSLMFEHLKELNIYLSICSPYYRMRLVMTYCWSCKQEMTWCSGTGMERSRRRGRNGSSRWRRRSRSRQMKEQTKVESSIRRKEYYALIFRKPLPEICQHAKLYSWEIIRTHNRHMSRVDHAKTHDARACVSLATCVFIISSLMLEHLKELYIFLSICSPYYRMRLVMAYCWSCKQEMTWCSGTCVLCSRRRGRNGSSRWKRSCRSRQMREQTKVEKGT
jgi:hypothetical protein